MSRNEIAQKRQSCEEAFKLYDKFEKFEYEINSKEIQTTPETRTMETQTDIIYQEKSIQCNIQKDTEMYASQNEMSVYSGEIDNESIDDMGSSFVLSESDSSSCSDFVSNDNKDDTKSTAFIVFCSSLVILFGKCLTCFDKSVKITRKVHGSLLIIMMTCSNDHKNIWSSLPSVNRQFLGNILISSATLFSANTFQRIFDFFHLVGIQCIGKTRFYEFQRPYLAGAVQERYCRENNSILNQLKEQGSCRLSGDGRCDSPEHNAKYLTYSFMDQITNKIAALTITQVTEAKNSNNMEKVGFIKGLKFLRTNGVIVDQITTDRHWQIRKYIRENEKDTIHQFDIWHFCKSIKKNL